MPAADEPPRAPRQRCRRGARLQVCPTDSVSSPVSSRKAIGIRRRASHRASVGGHRSAPWRSWGDPQPCSHLVVRAPGCKQRDDLTLTRGNRRCFPLHGQLHHGGQASPPIEGRPFVTGCICGCINRPNGGEDTSAPKRPSGLAVVLAFGGALAVAAALVFVAVVFRDGGDNGSETPPLAPTVDFTRIPQDGATSATRPRPSGSSSTRISSAPAAGSTVSVFPGIVDDYVRPGRVKTEFRGYPFLGEDLVQGAALRQRSRPPGSPLEYAGSALSESGRRELRLGHR